MQKIIYHRQGFRYMLLIAAAGVVIPIASFATQNDGTDPNVMEHICILPEVQPNADSSCTPEVVAYAAAINSLNNAQLAANEAYRRWYQCEMMNGKTKPKVEIPSAEYSVLVRE